MAPHCKLVLTFVLRFAAHPDDCAHTGSRAVPAQRDSGPPLGCTHAPASPAWDLLTPPHRAGVAKTGFAPGDARALPRLLVRYRCTGLRLMPKVVAEVRTLGYVLDLGERRCR